MFLELWSLDMQLEGIENHLYMDTTENTKYSTALFLIARVIIEPKPCPYCCYTCGASNGTNTVTGG